MDAVAKYGAKKVLGDRVNKYRKNKSVCGNQDPYFELVKDRRGKKRKVKRRIPDYIPEHDAELLAKTRNAAYKMDMCLFEFATVRFGWSSVIGIIPEIGDVAELIIAVGIYKRYICKVDCDLGSSTHARMIGNIAFDFLVGLVPFLGDIADAGFKCNTRNAVLLSEALDKAYALTPDGKHRLSPEEKLRAKRELFPDDPDFAYGPRPFPSEPEVRDEEQGDGRSWFARLFRGQRQPDPEMAEAPQR